MGRAIERPTLSGSSTTTRRLREAGAIKMEFSHRGLHWISIDERTVKTAYLKPVWSNGPYTAEGFRRIGTAAYLIMARRLISTKKAGYIDADFLSSIPYIHPSWDDPAGGKNLTWTKPDFLGSTRPTHGIGF
jgi:hypothetical protein